MLRNGIYPVEGRSKTAAKIDATRYPRFCAEDPIFFELLCPSYGRATDGTKLMATGLPYSHTSLSRCRPWERYAPSSWQATCIRRVQIARELRLRGRNEQTAAAEASAAESVPEERAPQC